ncbi:helix-turn-helix domain-containing protein [Streptomyces sp. NPDC054952]
MTAREDYGAALKAAADPYLARAGHNQGTLARALGRSPGALSKCFSGKSLPKEGFLDDFCEVLDTAGTPVPEAEKGVLRELRHLAYLSRPASEQAGYLQRQVESLERELQEVKKSHPSDQTLARLRAQVKELEQELLRARARLRGMYGGQELVPAGTRLPELSPLRPRSRRIDADLAHSEVKARKVRRELERMDAHAVQPQPVAVRTGDPAALVSALDSAPNSARLAEALATLRQRSGGEQEWPTRKMTESAFPFLQSIREDLEDAVECALNGTAVLAQEDALKRLVKAMGASDAEQVAFTAAHVNIRGGDSPTMFLPGPSQPLDLQPPTRWQRLYAHVHSCAAVTVCGTLSTFTVVSRGGQTSSPAAVWTLIATAWATAIWIVTIRPLGSAAASRPSLLVTLGCPLAVLLPMLSGHVLW